MNTAKFNNSQFAGPAYNPVDDMLKVCSMQKKFRDSFGGSAVNPAKWDTVLGTGQTAVVSAGVLTLASGTAANAEGYVLSKDTFTIPFRVSVGLTLSQRISNQSFFIEAVSVDPVTGVPDGQNACAMVFDGTTATTHKYLVQNSGVAPLVSSGATFPTSASGSVYEIEPFADECWFHGGTLDATTGRANSYRRHQQIPDPNALYKLRLRWLNGATPPASSTGAAIQFIACQDYAELTAEITAGRGNAVAGSAIGVAVTNSVPVTGSVAIAPSTSQGYATSSKLISAASTNLTSVRNSATNLGLLMAHNTSGSLRYLKLYNKASAPVLGTDVPLMVIPLPPNGAAQIPIPAAGVRFSTGFALAITGGMADADATAIGANEVVVNWSLA